MAKNVGLIHQIKGNISKVLSIYSGLSIDFSNIVHQHRASATVNPANCYDDKVENPVDDSAEHVPEKSE
ncbi:Protein EARLY FLOWERING 4 [Sesbania bispinosa]|nr:Protein EARLY FLOWERING 4 [Sesbania bispinosa]